MSISVNSVIKIMTDLNTGFQPVIDQLKEDPSTAETVFEQWVSEVIQTIHRESGDSDRMSRILRQQLSLIGGNDGAVNLPIANSSFASPPRGGTSKMFESPQPKLSKTTSPTKKKRPATAAVKSSIAGNFSESPGKKSKKAPPVKSLVDLVKKKDRLSAD